MWHELWVATALILVIEGVWPFLSPESMRRAMLSVAEQDNRTLRSVGLISMLVGVGLLYFVN